jgi:hypothetical protein
MAGRGTDIQLGGNLEMLARQEANASEGPEFETALARHKTEVDAARPIVREAGGLFVIGTERHESRRIDNQLRGRSGRQGDPGASRFLYFHGLVKLVGLLPHPLGAQSAPGLAGLSRQAAAYAVLSELALQAPASRRYQFHLVLDKVAYTARHVHATP